MPGDNARFDNTGGANTNVNIVGSVGPGSVTVDSTSNYFFTGGGSIDGIGGLTKTNSGTLTMLSTNGYTGGTTINGGVVAIPSIANGGTASPIGAASADPSAITFNGGTLSYFGPSAGTDHGMTFSNTGGTVDVVGGTALTLNGDLVGTGGLTVIDNGTLILNGASDSYAGPTTIAGGHLQLNNGTAASAGNMTFSNGTLIYWPSGGITVANPFNFTAGTTNTIIATSISGGNNPISGGNWSGSGVVADQQYGYLHSSTAVWMRSLSTRLCWLHPMVLHSGSTAAVAIQLLEAPTRLSISEPGAAFLCVEMRVR